MTRSLKSFDCAALPLTFTVTPSTAPTVSGTTRPRMSSSAAVDSDRAVAAGRLYSATVPSLLYSTSVPFSAFFALLASRWSSAIPAATVPLRTSSAVEAA